MTLRLRHTVIAALLAGTFITTPAFAGGVLGGVGGTIGGGGTLGATVSNLPVAPMPAAQAAGKVSADVGVGADVNGRAAIDTVTGTAGTLRGQVDATGDAAVATAHGAAVKGVRIVNRTGATVKGSAEAAVDAGASQAEDAQNVLSAADAKLNLEATASASSDVSSSLKSVGKASADANADASGDAWFDIF